LLDSLSCNVFCTCRKASSQQLQRGTLPIMLRQHLFAPTWAAAAATRSNAVSSVACTGNLFPAALNSEAMVSVLLHTNNVCRPLNSAAYQHHFSSSAVRNANRPAAAAAAAASAALLANSGHQAHTRTCPHTSAPHKIGHCAACLTQHHYIHTLPKQLPASPLHVQFNSWLSNTQSAAHLAVSCSIVTQAEPLPGDVLARLLPAPHSVGVITPRRHT
jgi:hypothetical protein